MPFAFVALVITLAVLNVLPLAAQQRTAPGVLVEPPPANDNSTQTVSPAFSHTVRKSPYDFGAAARGADDTVKLQAAIDDLKTIEPDTTYAMPSSAKRHYRRTLDLAGRVWRISAPLNLCGAHGLRLTNGAIYVAASTPFALGRAVLENDGVDCGELRGLFIDDVSIQCNHACNGIHIQKFHDLRMQNTSVLGWGKREFGIKLGPQGYSTSSAISGLTAYGFAEGYSDNPVSTRTATAIISNVNDITISDSLVHGGAENVLVTAWTQFFNFHVWNGSPGSETFSTANNVNIHFSGGSGGVYNSYIDNGCILIEGQPINIQIQNTKFLSNQATLDYAIRLQATTIGQSIADFLVSGNQLFGPFDRFIMVDESGGTYTTMDRALVTDNTLRTYRTGYNAILTTPSLTRGTVQFFLPTTAFNGSTFKVDMRRYLLHWKIANPALTFGPLLLLAGSTVTIQSYTYDKTTGFATITASGKPTSNSYLTMHFDQSHEVPPLNATSSGVMTPTPITVP